MNTSKESNAQPHPESSPTDELAQPSTVADRVSEPSERPEPIENLIRMVNYRRLKNLGNHENETVEASAYCLQIEDPAEVLEKLRVWVHSHLGISYQDVQRLRQEGLDAQDSLWALQAEAYDLQKRIEKMRTWAAEYGTKFMVDLDQALPF